jgi:hypothetical protein
VAPVEVASGDCARHRLPRGGDRQLNLALHFIARTQVRMPASRGRAYYDTKIAEGKTSNEAMRCLKRRLADRVWRIMIADERRLAVSPGGQSGATLQSSAAGSTPTTSSSDKILMPLAGRSRVVETGGASAADVVVTWRGLEPVDKIDAGVRPGWATPGCCLLERESQTLDSRGLRGRRAEWPFGRELTVEIVYERVAAIDVGKKVIAVAVRTPGDRRGQRRQQLRKFNTYYRTLVAMVAWLVAEGVTHVTMEATGVIGDRCFMLCVRPSGRWRCCWSTLAMCATSRT